MTIDVTQKKEEGKGGQRRTPQKLEVRTSDESNRDGGTDGSGAGDNFVALKARLHSLWFIRAGSK